MRYEEFCATLNRSLFEAERISLLDSIASNPERFIGLFRPTKPKAKVLQNVLYSHEIKFGNAIENIIEKYLVENGFTLLDKKLTGTDDKKLNLDLYFTRDNKTFATEQKMRDDHDSSNKTGQLNKFEKKIGLLVSREINNLEAIIFFVDNSMKKNKKYFEEELANYQINYGIPIKLFYGRDFFDYLKCPAVWDEICQYLKDWKNTLPELPEINFDNDPARSFDEIKNLNVSIWRRLVDNDVIWKDGLMKVIFRDGTVLKMIRDYYITSDIHIYKYITARLTTRLNNWK